MEPIRNTKETKQIVKCSGAIEKRKAPSLEEERSDQDMPAKQQKLIDAPMPAHHFGIPPSESWELRLARMKIARLEAALKEAQDDLAEEQRKHQKSKDGHGIALDQYDDYAQALIYKGEDADRIIKALGISYSITDEELDKLARKLKLDERMMNERLERTLEEKDAEMRQLKKEAQRLAVDQAALKEALAEKADDLKKMEEKTRMQIARITAVKNRERDNLYYSKVEQLDELSETIMELEDEIKQNRHERERLTDNAERAAAENRRLVRSNEEKEAKLKKVVKNLEKEAECRQCFNENGQMMYFHDNGVCQQHHCCRDCFPIRQRMIRCYSCNEESPRKEFVLRKNPFHDLIKTWGLQK